MVETTVRIVNAVMTEEDVVVMMATHHSDA